MNFASPYKSPSKLFDELGITEPQGIDIEAIAQYCGATTTYEPLTGCEAFLIGSGNRAIITVNSQSQRARQRFSIAHELGHWMLDRGKATSICQEQALTTDWSSTSSEAKANEYAKELLLPEKMFRPLAKGREITFATVKDLARTFETSLTATAIRLIELGSFPAMLIFNNKKGKSWFRRGEDVPPFIHPVEQPGYTTIAQQMLAGKIRESAPRDISADEWIRHKEAYHYKVREDSLCVTGEMVLTLLWWKDEKQLLDLSR